MVTSITRQKSSTSGGDRVHVWGRFVAIAICVLGCTVPPISTGSVPPRTPSQPSSPSRAVDYRRLESEVTAELNAVRANPRSYVPYLSQLLTMFNGKLLSRPGWPVPVQTVEGPSAVREAIAALNAQAAEPQLAVASGLASAAHDLASDQSRTGATGHTASDGAGPPQRIDRYGTWGVSYSENVDYGQFTSGREVVEDLIMDDGVPDRGHRRNIFDPSARVVGVACAPHPKYGSVCVIDQAGSFTAGR